MDKGETTILGVNTSHDGAVAVVVDGEVKHVYEEERSRRTKYWSPRDDSVEGDNGVSYDELGLLCIDHKQLHSPDYLAFASFDRRDFHITLHDRVFRDRLLQQEMVAEFSKQQLSRKRLDEIQKQFGPTVFRKNGIYLEEDNSINDAIARQVFGDQEKRTYDFKHEHHYFHAVCASHLSPYDESIVITWDGGGFNSHFEDWPGYQEIEGIWHHKGDTVTPIWKRYSNHRMMNDLSQRLFYQFGENCCEVYDEEEYELDGVASVFTSMPSMGMNFSNMSYALGADELGRAAGKVMGMASYSDLQDKVWTKHSVAQRLEHDSLEHSCGVIQNAINRLPDVKNIVLSGGYSLNCTNNYKYLQRFPDHQFFVDPIPHDGGTAVGCALDYYRRLNANN